MHGVLYRTIAFSNCNNILSDRRILMYFAPKDRTWLVLYFKKLTLALGQKK